MVCDQPERVFLTLRAVSRQCPLNKLQSAPSRVAASALSLRLPQPRTTTSSCPKGVTQPCFLKSRRDHGQKERLRFREDHPCRPAAETERGSRSPHLQPRQTRQCASKGRDTNPGRLAGKPCRREEGACRLLSSLFLPVASPTCPCVSRADSFPVVILQYRVSSGPGVQPDLWVHDLYGASGPPAQGSLASRITVPGAAGAGKQGAKKQPQQQRRAAKLAFALTRDEAQAPAQRAANVTTRAANTTSNRGGGISIRGLAGPPVVMAQNFAPGTTAADIESAFTPYGGIVSRCRLLKTSPIIIAEIVFEDPNGAQRVIDQFNNQVADGRLLKVYHKAGPGPEVSAPSSAVNGNIIDGSHGFGVDEPMADAGPGGSKLYSDSLIQGKKGNRGWKGAGR
ncbi:hypothetical protein RB600_009640 [Gaeumannomyces tritici]